MQKYSSLADIFFQIIEVLLATKVNKKKLDIQVFGFWQVILNLAVCLALSINGFAQYSSNEFPAIGTNFVMAKSQVYPHKKMTIRELGTTVWDFSDFKPTNFDTIRIADPLKTRYGKRFPESNVVMVLSPIKMEYLTIDSGSVYLSGLVDDFMEKKLPVLLRFGDKLLYRNPHLQTDQEYSDTSETFFLSPYYQHPGTDSIKADIFYVRTGRVDASGELITPLGKFNVDREVIFVEKRVRGYKYSVFGWTPTPEYSLDKHYTFYRWYTKDVKLPVAEAYLNDQDFIEYVRYQYDSPLKLYFTGEDVSCKGGSDGKVDLTIIGGIPDYTYQWTNGATTQDLKTVKAGTYRVVVTDNRGRTISSYYTVSEPIVELQAKVEVTNISCKGNKDGKAKLNIIGGKAPYDFAWSNDSTVETMTHLSPGIIKYMVLDAGGCRIVDSIEITQPDEKLSAVAIEKHVSCLNGNDGNVEIVAKGGTAPYIFDWADDHTSRIKSNMRAGIHKFTVYDKNNCSYSSTVTIKQPETALKVTKEIKPVGCFGESNGSADLMVSGGKAPYQYFWSDSSINKSLKGYPTGRYMVEIMDKNDCKINETVEITQPFSALQLTSTKKEVNCFEGNDGEIHVIASGGTQPYEYNWSNGDNKHELSKLTKGLYKLKLIDKNGCTITESIEISAPDKGIFADFEKTDVKCYKANTGTIKLTVEGGTPDYTYLWSNKSTNKDLDGLRAGKYQVVITDKNLCQLKREIDIIEPETQIDIDVEQINAGCYGEKGGSIYLNVKGGKPGYDLEWSTGETSSRLIGIGAGKYTAKITDRIGCEQTKIIQITEPVKLTINFELKSPDADQNNGSIKIDITGGTKPYSILWDNGQSSAEAKNLTTGIYELQIKDSKGCLLEEEIELKGK